MERLLTKNIERYRRMLANPRDEAQRRMILKLLAEEGAKLKGHPATGGGNGLNSPILSGDRSESR
jgi:hypothetical protein